MNQKSGNFIDLMNCWFDSNNRDFDTMKVLFKNRKNTWCLFIGHLVIEKILNGRKENLQIFFLYLQI